MTSSKLPERALFYLVISVDSLKTPCLRIFVHFRSPFSSQCSVIRAVTLSCVGSILNKFSMYNVSYDKLPFDS